MAKKSKFACPKCGGQLQITTTIMNDIDPDTGLVDDCPSVDRYICCQECSNDENIKGADICAINLKANKLP